MEIDYGSYIGTCKLQLMHETSFRHSVLNTLNWNHLYVVDRIDII